MLTISPAPASLDEPLRVHIAGLPPGERVTVRASAGAGAGRMESRVRFVADPSGVVDLTRDAPLDGDYAGVDPMGLVWSLRPAADPSNGAAQGGFLAPSELTIRVEVAGELLAGASVSRLRLPQGVEREEIQEDGVVGVLFRPTDGGRHPGVLLVGGSEGGLHEMDAALMAGRGFTVLAQAYFGAPGVPAQLVDIPLETFVRSTDWLAAHAHVRGAQVGMIGGSRGGEAALLVGATTPVVGAVVSTVGSGVMTQGIGPGRSFLEVVGTPVASWTLDGQRLPYLRNVITPALERQVAHGEPVELGLVFEAGLAAATPDELEAVTIPVERIDGGVLLVSAGDDRMWPSGPLSEIAAARLERGGHRHPFRHLHYPEAGHPIAPPPYGSTTQTILPGPGVRFRAGGTPAATARARADAWQQSLRFLREQLTR